MGSEPSLTPPAGLMVAGLCHDGASTIVLVAPQGAAFWKLFCDSPECLDGQQDPMDRLSKRLIGAWAAQIGAEALFPSDGPPYSPFLDWALASGRCWSSPMGMLVHDTQGLMISFRGALRLKGCLPLPPKATAPCQSCAQPCRSACPANAFEKGYDTKRCHAFLDSIEGRDCMSQGCSVRRACPISIGCGRLPEHSAWHMRQFHP